jgi:hypothetical protein
MNNFNAGIYKKQYHYESFSPSLVNRKFDWADKKIDLLLSQAMRLLESLMLIPVLFRI